MTWSHLPRSHPCVSDLNKEVEARSLHPYLLEVPEAGMLPGARSQTLSL